MTDFLIKSTLSLAVLLVVYHLALEKEKMHQFNRFYLLFGLLFSLFIPFITIEIIQEISHQETTSSIIPMKGGTSMPIIEDSINYWLIAAWVLYGLITLALLSRFVLNIWKLNARTQSNPIIDYKNAKLVLLQEKTLPYTFLNHIFINETDYHNRKIEAELYTHELTHVNQKHSLDILFIEMLKVLFWFNPIFVFYKKAIQLNHEFLADQKVVNSHNNVPFYQNLLLSKVNANPTYYLASNLNYSVTKKRLIMMTKTASKSRAILKKGILIPLLTALVFSYAPK
jgi:beta-lactamase regulating signal transducer with metallopeptidase domain